MMTLNAPRMVVGLFSLAALSLSILSSPVCFGGQLTAIYPAELKQPAKPDVSALQKYDIVFVVDKSQSMERRDCPMTAIEAADVETDAEPAAELSKAEVGTGGQNGFRNVSRWKWCQKQLTSFLNLGAKKLPSSRLVLFSDDVKVYDKVGLNELTSAFANNKPSGITRAADTLRTQLNEYFRQKEVNGSTRPLLIVVITDGGLDSKIPLRRAIIEATDRMDNPDEITISFLTIGHDFRAQNLEQVLNRKPSSANKKFDIVHVKDFDEVNKVGLAQALLQVVGPQTDDSIAVNTQTQDTAGAETSSMLDPANTAESASSIIERAVSTSEQAAFRQASEQATLTEAGSGANSTEELMSLQTPSEEPVVMESSVSYRRTNKNLEQASSEFEP